MPAGSANGVLSVAPPWIAVYTESQPGLHPYVASIVATASIDLEGTVTDQSGLPLADVNVVPRLDPLVDFPDSLAQATQIKLEPTTTDAQGYFALPGLPTGVSRLEFRKLGHVIEVRIITQDMPHWVYVALTEIAHGEKVISGTVRGPEGSVIADARVGLGKREVQTNKFGRYRLTIPAGSKVNHAEALWAAKPEHQTEVIAGFGERVATEPFEFFEQDLSFAGPDLQIAGTVLNSDADPYPDLLVYPWREPFLRGDDTAVDLAVSEDSEPLSLGSGSARSYARTTADGSFRLRGLADRSYRLRILDRQAGWGFTTEPIRAGIDGATVLLPSDLIRKTVSGQVVTPDGEPVRGVIIWTHLTVYGDDRGSISFEQGGPAHFTDGEGHFEIADFPRYGVELSFDGMRLSDNGYLLQALTLAPDDVGTNLVIVIERRCLFRIALTDPAFASAKVHLLDDEGRNVWIQKILARSVWPGIQPTLHDGKSMELAASELATMLVAVAGKRELRIPIKLVPGKVELVTR